MRAKVNFITKEDVDFYNHMFNELDSWASGSNNKYKTLTYADPPSECRELYIRVCKWFTSDFFMSVLKSDKEAPAVLKDLIVFITLQKCTLHTDDKYYEFEPGTCVIYAKTEEVSYTWSTPYLIVFTQK